MVNEKLVSVDSSTLKNAGTQSENIVEIVEMVDLKKNNFMCDVLNEIECRSELDIVQTEDDFQQLVDNLLNTDFYSPKTYNDNNINISSSKNVSNENEPILCSFLLSKDKNQGLNPHHTDILNPEQTGNCDLQFVMNDHNYISPEMTAYSKKFNPQLKSLSKLKQILLAYLIEDFCSLKYTFVSLDNRKMQNELNRYAELVLQNFSLFILNKFPMMSTRPEHTGNKEYELDFENKNVDIIEDFINHEFQLPKANEFLDENEILKYAQRVNLFYNKQKTNRNPPVELTTDKVLLSDNASSKIYGKNMKTNYETCFQTNSLMDNCSEPLEYFALEDPCGVFEDECFVDETLFLQQLTNFASQLLEDCEVFRSSKKSIRDKLLGYITSKYSEFKIILQALYIYCDQSIQTKKKYRPQKLEKRNTSKINSSLQFTDTSTSSYYESESETERFSVASISDSSCFSQDQPEQLMKKKSMHKNNIIYTKHSKLDYDDCVTLRNYIQSEIFESDTASQKDLTYIELVDDVTYPEHTDDAVETATLTMTLRKPDHLAIGHRNNKPQPNTSDEEINKILSGLHSSNLCSKEQFSNYQCEDNENKEVQRLINLNGLKKKQSYSPSNKISKLLGSRIRKEENNKLDITRNVAQKGSHSDESLSELEDEIITEKQFLERFNQNLKHVLLNGSTSDSESESNDCESKSEHETFNFKRGSPSVEKFLQNYNAYDSQYNMSHDTQDISIANENEGENISKANEILAEKCLPIEFDQSTKLNNNSSNIKNDMDSSNDSDCEFLKDAICLRKQSKPKTLDKLISEANKRNEIKLNEDDFISLSSESESSDVETLDKDSIETNRIIKPMLRQDQLASETRNAQKLEADRVRRLEKKQTVLNEALSSQSNFKGYSKELVLDYNTETKTFIKVHADLVKHLKPHQVDGVKFMYDSCYGGIDILKKSSGSGCILAHCMGLGKTLQLIALLHTVITYKELKTTKILVLCPKSTVMNWADEIQRWLGPLKTKNLKLYTFNDTSDINEKLNTLKEWSLSTQGKAGCLLIGYEAFRTLVFYHSYRNRGSVTSSRLEEIRENVYKHLLKPGADLVVCDEGHIIKNRKSAISLAVAEIITPKRIILTGTPIQNNLKEYYSMVNFIKPLFLGTEKEFANLYANPIKNGQHKDSSKRDIKVMKQRSFVLHKKLSKFVQRKEAQLLKSFLPQKYEYVLFIPMTGVQNNLYEFILDAISKRDDNRGRSLITDYTCLRKIWTHPKVLEDAWKNATVHKNRKDMKKQAAVHTDEDEPDDIYDSRTGIMSVTHDWWRHLVTINDLETILPSKKIRTMFEILRMCKENGEKCLIFSAFVAVLNVVEYFFKKINDEDPETLNELNISYSLHKNRHAWLAGQDYYRLDGKTPKSIRHEMIKSFNSTQNKRARVFLISAKAGGQGINLIGANRVIILDTSWNPSNDQQNIFRIFRLGQKKNCYVYRLLAMGTMEEKVYSRSVTKQAMSFRVVDEQQIDRHYNMAELAELYTLTKPNYSKRPMPVFPQDNILANLLLNYPDLVYKYHEHDSLLENQVEQELSEQDKADAWTLYERDLNFSSEIRDMPLIEGLSFNFPTHRVEQYFNAVQRFDPSFSSCGSLAQNSVSNPVLEAFSRFNYPTTSQQYLEMISMLRKVSPSVKVYPELNKPITEETFNTRMISSTKPAINASAPCNDNKGSILSNISASTNPLLALGDLSLYGVGSIKQNKSAFCPPTFTHSPLASAYVKSQAGIFKQFEQFKSALDSDINSGNQAFASLQSGRERAPHSNASSNSTFSPLLSHNTLRYGKSQQSYPNIQTEEQHNQISSHNSSSYVCVSKKQEADNKKDSLSSTNSTPSCISNIPPRSPSLLNNNFQKQKSQGPMKLTYSSPNETSCITDTGMYYPTSKNISSLTKVCSTNMGIVYPNKDNACVSPTTAKKKNELETIGAFSEMCLPKQPDKIYPNISLIAAPQNINMKTSVIMNTVKPSINPSIGSDIPNTEMNQPHPTTQTRNRSGFSTYNWILNQKIQSKEAISSYNKKKHSLKEIEVVSQNKNLGNKSNPFIHKTTKPTVSETQKLPIIPITSTTELKKRIELSAPSLPFAKNALSIREVENKQNPSGGGVFIIEANVNQKKLAIGTPTKSGGGTTITKVLSLEKRKADHGVLYEDPQEGIKRPKMSTILQQKYKETEK